MGRLIGTLIFLFLVGLAGLYFAYGEVDPCRALAVERARRAETSTGLPIRGPAERWTRLETSQLSTGECVGDLLSSWGERLSHKFHRAVENRQR